MSKKVKKIKDHIYDYLYDNGLQHIDKILEYVREFIPETKKSVLSSTLYQNRHLFVKTEGKKAQWNLIKDSVEERQEKTVCKMGLLLDHYKDLLDKIGANGDTRLAGVELDDFDKNFINMLVLKHKKS